MLKKTIICCVATVLFFWMSISIIAANTPSLILTESEKEYFSQVKVLRVLAAPDTQPYSYHNAGVSVDILKRLCAAADIELQLIEADSYADAIIRLERGEAELATVNFSSSTDMENSVPYLKSPLQMVSHKQTDLSEREILSTVKLEGVNFYYDDENHSFGNYMTLDSVRDCLNVVRGQQADIFLCDMYQLSIFSESFVAQELTITHLPLHEVTVGFGLGANADERLVSALQSTVCSFSASELSSLLMEHQQVRDVDLLVAQFVNENHMEILCAVVSLFFVILICIFVSTRIRASQHQELRGYEESYRMLANTFGEAGLEYDFLNDRLTFFGGRLNRIDLPETVEQVQLELEKQTLRISLTSQDLKGMLQNNTPDQSYGMELQCGIKDGSWNWFRMIYIVVCTSASHRRPIRLIGCLVNIEEERQELERLQKIGRYDQLTGLLNRASGEREIIHKLNEDEVPKVLLAIDIDYFKNFNDHYGHSCGDAVLSMIGRVLREIFSQEDTLCRWGGDEFLLFVRGEGAQSGNLYANLKKLQVQMNSFAYLEHSLSVTLSIGGAAAPADMPFRSLFELADSTLYDVKNKGRNNFAVIYPSPDASEKEACE